MARTTRPTRPAFSLLEAVVVVIVLALAVPGAMRMLAESGEARRQGAETARAVTLASAVLEHVIADVNSPAVGFDALADANAYLNTATTGLYDRLETVAAAYPSMTYEVSIGALGNASGVATGDADEDVFRRVTVTVAFDDADGNTLELPVTVILTELSS